MDKPVETKLRTGGLLVWRVLRLALVTTFVVVGGLGLVRAWSVPGYVDDRRAELQRLNEQILEQQARSAWLESHLEAFRERPDVRMHTIRSELGMLRENERFYVFK